MIMIVASKNGLTVCIVLTILVPFLLPYSGIASQGESLKNLKDYP